MSATEVGNAAIRESMNEGLAKLNGAQLGLFRRMFGEHVPDEKLQLAHDVVERTLQKMEKEGRP